ncbi:phage tail tape measure protein [Erwinia pyrifoliae]|uniref:phage tail tape measure protein n=1 Tax=Erwinia pyrifoliae TaxID=79967 RepID=UPI0022084C4F|nr:phage tail tape measure protein [Erwinia pyrifoliae]MCT2388632.1 phage tail tape measure protein [Erwinia pyrifoliae]MCU8586801.1 phage tail tape measure protein [Erwinia pyrifoliae]UWS30678.1 phage tail tape measure protein [Erwinia pyrifoliae]
MKSLNIRVAFSAIDKLTRPVNAARQSTGGLSESLKKTQSAIKELDSQSRTFNRLRDSVQKTSRKIDEAARTLDGLNNAQREGTQLTDRQREHMAALASKLERLNTTRTQEMVKLRAASQALRSHGVSLVGSDRTIQSAIRRTEQYNQTLERERRQLAAVTQARARYDRMQQTAGKLRGGGTMAVAGASAAGYAGGRFLAPAVGFDEEMSRVQALTRLDKGNSQLAALRVQAKKLGAETAFTSRDAASGQAFLAMAGFTPQAIQAALPGVLNMALAGGMELGESADIGSNVLSQFRLDPKEMDRVSDVLTAAFTRSNTDLRGIGEAMTYAGVGAEKLGISVEETAAMVGMLAKQGIRGSMAGTGLRTSLSRLASPVAKAKDALQELGVTVADSAGKMRPIGNILTDLYKTTKNYGNTDQLSFFKDIAGEEAANSLQNLVQLAGNGELQALIGDLKSAQGEAQKAAKVMADNLGGDLKNLDSAWEGFRIQIEETTDGPLRGLTQSLSDAISSVSEWVKENPKLTQSLLLIGGTALALTLAVGGLSLAIGLLAGPLAKLQLGFSVLTGGRGISGTINAFRTLGTASGAALASVRGWGPILASLSGKLRGVSVIVPGLRAGLIGAFMAPGAALGSLAKGIGRVALRLTGLPALWSIITVAVSALGTALSLLFSPIGLIVAAFVAAGVLIWKYWEPLKAFFSGVFAGIMEKLAPLRETFEKFRPVFDAIGEGIGKVVNGFKALFTPMASSKETLDKCASAGSAFGNVLGGALRLVLAPAKMLLDTLAWILEKLGVLPDEAERARKKIEEAQSAATLKSKIGLLQGDIAAITLNKNNSPFVGPPVPPGYTPPLTGDNGTMRRLQNIDSNTKATADNTKKIGPGDIVFKNLPRALAVRGEWQESRLARTTTADRLSARPAVVAASLPVRQAELPAVRRSASNMAATAGGFTGEIHVHLHGVERQDAREIGRIAADAVNAELARRERLGRGSFKDRD